LLGTAPTRAGATSTKSGTWLREMALRAMPGTSMMSKMAYKKHEGALKEVGLVDNDHKPTWFTDGKPDLLKMLDIAGANAQKIPIERRAAYQEGSTVQAARTGMATFNNTMMDLGQIALPAVNKGLGDLKAILEGIRSVLPDDKGAPQSGPA
jgi:hypothetical protein